MTLHFALKRGSVLQYKAALLRPCSFGISSPYVSPPFLSPPSDVHAHSGASSREARGPEVIIDISTLMTRGLRKDTT